MARGSRYINNGKLKGTLTNHSGTITTGGTAQQVVAANANRNYLLLQNQSTGDLWFDLGVDAVQSQPSLKLVAGDSVVWEDNYIPTSSVSIIGATTGQAFAAKEG